MAKKTYLDKEGLLYYNEKLKNILNTKADSTTVNNQISTLDTKIETTKTSLEGTIATTKTELEGTINATKVALEGSINTTNTNLNTLRTNTETSIGNLETKDAEHDASISTLEAKDTAHDTDIAGLKAKDTAHDTAIANLVTKDTELDTDITNLQTRDTQHDAAISNLNSVKADKTAVTQEITNAIAGVTQFNYEVVNELQKVKHNHFMSSLAKTKDWDEFIRYFGNKDVIGMLKLDGLTCSLHYLDGRLVGAETRGNGEVGEDILHNAKVLPSIPNRINYRNELIIDGEIICDVETFNKDFAEDYANPRNFAAGSIRLLDSQECKNRHLTFVAWNIVTGFEETNSFMEKLNKLEKLGFVVTPWTSSFDWDAKEFLINRSKELGYPIDGLVGRFDDIEYGISLGSTGHHSKAAYAFKFYDEVYETTLIKIEWTMGRTGILTPVAVFEPLDIEGSVVERASLHNISFIKEKLGLEQFIDKRKQEYNFLNEKNKKAVPYDESTDKEVEYKKQLIQYYEDICINKKHPITFGIRPEHIIQTTKSNKKAIKIEVTL